MINNLNEQIKQISKINNDLDNVGKNIFKLEKEINDFPIPSEVMLVLFFHISFNIICISIPFAIIYALVKYFS